MAGIKSIAIMAPGNSSRIAGLLAMRDALQKDVRLATGITTDIMGRQQEVDKAAARVREMLAQRPVLIGIDMGSET